MTNARLLRFAVGCLVLLTVGCTERPSTTSSSPESASPPDTPKAIGAAKRANTWREARRRGVHFRAIGQEPGWIVAVTADSLQLEWNYGQQVASGPRTEANAVSSGAAVRYRAETGKGPVWVRAVERRCVDPMNGDAFPLTVTVRVQTDTLTGCGKKLR